MPEESSINDTAQPSGDSEKDGEQLGCMQLGTCGALKFEDGSALHESGFDNDDSYIDVQSEEFDNATKERRNFTFPAMLMSEGLRNGYWYDGEKLEKATARGNKPLKDIPLVGATGEHKHEFFSQIGRLHSFKFNKKAKGWDCLATIWNDPHIPKAAQAVAIGRQLNGKLPISLRAHGNTYIDPVHGIGIDNFEFVHGSVVLEGSDPNAAVFTNTDSSVITHNTGYQPTTTWTYTGYGSTSEIKEGKEEPTHMTEEKPEIKPEAVAVDNAIDIDQIKADLLAELKASNEFMTREQFDNALEHEKKVLNLLHLDSVLEEYDNLLRTMPSEQLDMFTEYVGKKQTAVADMQAKIDELEGKAPSIDTIKPTDGSVAEPTTVDNADEILAELAKGGSVMAQDLLAKRNAVRASQKVGE